jgi:hypothetical protein
VKRAQITLNNGERVEGYLSSTPGLAVWHSPHSGKWCVIHMVSGRYVAQLRTRLQAERLAELLRGVGSWQRTAHDITADMFTRERATQEIRRAKHRYADEDADAFNARAVARAQKAIS